jgi:hypothetical protein
MLDILALIVCFLAVSYQHGRHLAAVTVAVSWVACSFITECLNQIFVPKGQAFNSFSTFHGEFCDYTLVMFLVFSYPFLSFAFASAALLRYLCHFAALNI